MWSGAATACRVIVSKLFTKSNPRRFDIASFMKNVVVVDRSRRETYRSTCSLYRNSIFGAPNELFGARIAPCEDPNGKSPG